MKRIRWMFIVGLLTACSQVLAVVGDQPDAIISQPATVSGNSRGLDEQCVIDFTGLVNGGGNSGTVHWPGGQWGGAMGMMQFTSSCAPNPLFAYCMDLAHYLDQNPYCALINDRLINPACLQHVPAMAYVMTWYPSASTLDDDIMQLTLWKLLEDASGVPYYCPPARANVDTIFHTNPAINDPANARILDAYGISDGIPKNVVMAGDQIVLSTPGQEVNGGTSTLVVNILLQRGAAGLAVGNVFAGGVKIILTSSSGTLSEDTVFTDPSGHAQVIITHPATGIVPVTVRACSRGLWPRSIEPCDPQLPTQDLVQVLQTGEMTEVCGELEDEFLAVELTSFDVRAKGDAVLLSWRSASETGLSRWELERRPSGAGAFVLRASLPAANAPQGNTYAFLDGSAEAGVVYDYRLIDVSVGGMRTVHDELMRSFSLPYDAAAMPQTHFLGYNYPNPFNPETSIRFSLPESGYTTLKVFDAVGREIAVLAAGDLNAGEHRAVFHAAGLPSGLYFYTLSTGSFTQTRKMILMK